jgi:hypothetical protein
MGIASGTVSFRRYHICGKLSATVDQRLIDRLQAHTFGGAEHTAPDGREIGWIAPTHLFDTHMAAEKITAGPYIHLAMRMDNTAAPANVVRSYRRMEELAALEASGKTSLNKEERRQAAEAAQARAEEEARSGAFRRISAHPLLVDPERHTVYFTSLGTGAHDKLMSLFADTFKARLEPLGAAELASRHADDAGRSRSFEDAAPAHMIEPPVAGEGLADEHDRSFLGREFLTWLWHEIEEGDGTVRLSANGRTRLPGEAALMIDRSMQLDCDFKLSGRATIHGDGPGRMPEARAALTTGKQPTRMGLVLSAGGETYSLTLEMPGFVVRGLKLPDIDEPNTPVRLEERCRRIVEVSDILDALYAAFLKARLGKDFKGMMGRLRQWAAGRGHQPAQDASLRIAT